MLNMVGNTGLEPARVAPLVPKTNVSANFTNSPLPNYINKKE